MRKNESFVAVFIDYENLCYGLLNQYHVEPLEANAVEQIFKVASRYGHVRKAEAFADFESNDKLRRDLNLLRVRGVDPKHVATTNEKSYTDFVMLDSLYRTYIESPEITTYVVVTGDGHFAPCLGYFRSRLGLQIIVMGVRDTVSSQLRHASSQEIEYVEPPARGARAPDLDKQLVRYLAEREGTGARNAFGKTVDYFMLNTGIEDRATVTSTLESLIKLGAVEQYTVEHEGRTVKLMRLNRGHEFVKQALNG